MQPVPISPMFKRAKDRLKELVHSLQLGKPATAWALSPYPDGKSFGFTIVHDADFGI